MNYKSIIKSITSISLISFFAGCALNQVNTVDYNGKVIENTNNKIEKIVYERPAVSELLKNRIRGILKAMSNNDLAKLNQEYIHPDFGFYNLHKIEGIKVFLEQKMIYNIIDYETEEISHIISRINTNSSNLLIIEKNVKFDCSPNDDAFYGWNDDGLYLSNNLSPYLSKMMTEANIYEVNKYKNKDFQKVALIEKTSYKVVLTPELSFYITKIDDNWYITLIDRITTDCSSIVE
jgi:hypothetical protein